MRHRRTWSASLVAFAAIFAMAAAVWVLLASSRDEGAKTVLRSGVAGENETQRLVFGPRLVAIADMPNLDANDMPWLSAIVEEQANGSLEVLSPRLPAGFATRTIVPTDDGGLLIAGSLDLQTGAARADGPNVEGVTFPLATIAPDGSLASQRDLRVVGESVMLLGASPNEAILERGTPGGDMRIVAHDLVTGSERDLGKADTWATVADVAEDVVVLAAAPCMAGALELSSGAETRLSLPKCSQVHGVRMSPNAQTIAVVYATVPSGAVSELRLATFERTGGRRLTDKPLGFTLPYGDADSLCRGTCPSGLPVDFAGIAWSTVGQVRVALIGHPASGDPREVTFPSAIHIETVAA